MVFFNLSKILSFFLTPLVWIFLLLVLALVTRKPARSRRYLLIALVVGLLFSNPLLLNLAVRAWEVPMSRIPAEKQVYDAGIVLGGGMVVYDKGYDRLIFKVNTDRFLQAYLLYKEGKIKKIMLSGGAGQLTYRDMLEAPLLKKYLLAVGMPPEDILMDSLSDNTRQNAVNTAAILHDSLPWGKYLLITSSMHMRRSVACFRKAGVIVEPYPTNKAVGKIPSKFQQTILPNMECFYGWEGLLHETVGFVIYKIMGYA